MASSRQLWLDSALTKKRDETDELLVFGYSCKLFRDDEKAIYIDQGKHLIPWMGDDSLKIDRYDVRGTVYDLRSLEPLAGGASEALWTSLSDAERRVEQLCDEERYRALYHNEAEEELYHEEELKRLHQALDPQNSYGQVAYSYDNEPDRKKSEDTESRDTNEQAETEDEDEPFIPPQELDTPVGMVLPERTKLNAIIEKTALFISTQGPQMEILLKMKQANNPQFSFLSYDCPLHAYYRHLLMAIKTGRYQPKREQQQHEQDSDASEHYLHPSLAATASRVELAPNIPSISYKPSADCAYSMLVNKIKDKQLKPTDENSGQASPGDAFGLGNGQYDPERNFFSQENIKGEVKIAFAVPSGELQLIIDKMASYVIKNGRDFESVVRSKGDDRFEFLEVGHKFHPYYEHKIRVYQGLEVPLTSPAVPSGSGQSFKKKKDKPKSPLKKQLPILLPGYEYSDDESDSDDEQTQNYNGACGSKPKLAPVSFSIKKPKETEMLKEVKSALPVEEESSDEDAEIDNNQVVKSPSANLESEGKRVALVSDPGLSRPSSCSSVVSNPGAEMEKLQQMLKDKEKQLKELERQKQIASKQNQDIFFNEVKERDCHVETLPSLPEDHLLLKENPQFAEMVENRDDIKLVAENKNSCVLSKHHELWEVKDTGKHKVDKEEEDIEKLCKENSEDEVIPEAEVIDLTDETNDIPKVSDSMRLERKRKAAAFLNLIRKDNLRSENGTSCIASDSDGSSKRSTPSPPVPHLLLRDRNDPFPNFNGASIPRTSLMARLAASSVLRRQPPADRRLSEETRDHRESDISSKLTRDRGKLICSSSERKHRKKWQGSLLECESRPHSRSMTYVRSSPHRRRLGDDCEPEQRTYRQPKDDRHKARDSHRRRHADLEESEIVSSHSHHKRHKDSRHCHTHSYFKSVREAKASSSDSTE